MGIVPALSALLDRASPRLICGFPPLAPTLEGLGWVWEPDPSVSVPRPAVGPDLDRAVPAAEVVVLWPMWASFELVAHHERRTSRTGSIGGGAPAMIRSQGNGVPGGQRTRDPSGARC
jgi:hypothetical protein